MTCHYTLDEWKALSDEERNTIRNARNAAKKEREQRGKQSQGNNKKKCNVSAATSTNTDEDESEQEIDVHEGNVEHIIRQKGMAAVNTEDAGDHMTSRHNTRARIKAVQTICHIRNNL